MLAALRNFRVSVVVGLVLLSLAGCSAKVYRAPDVGSLPIEELSVLELPVLTDKCQDIGYPDVSRHRLPLTPFFVSGHRLPSLEISATMFSVIST